MQLASLAMLNETFSVILKHCEEGIYAIFVKWTKMKKQPIFDTRFALNFAASTVITNSLQDLKERQQKLLFCAKLFASSKVSFHKTDRVQNKKKSVINQGLGVTFFTIYELIWIRPGHEQLVLALQRRRDKRPRNNRHQQKNDTLLLKQ